jgi:hypothetical protein
MANLSITAAWNDTTEFVKRESRLLFPIAFMLIALPVAVMEALTPDPAGPGRLPEHGVWTLLVPLVIIASMIGNLAISYLAIKADMSVGEAIGRGARRFLPLLGAFILLCLAGAILFLVAAIVAVLLVPGAMSDAAAGAQSPALARAVVLTVILLLPVLIFFGARLMLVTPVTAAEQGGSIAILRRSWSLTAGFVWKLAGFLLLIVILIGVLTTAVESVAGILFALLAGPLRAGSLSKLLTILVMAGVNTVVGVYLASLIARIYAQRAGASTSGS